MAEYKEVDNIYERVYEKADGDTFVYIADTCQDGSNYMQTDFDDFKLDRYEVRINRSMEPNENEDTVICSTMEWKDAEKFLDNIVT